MLNDKVTLNALRGAMDQQLGQLAQGLGLTSLRTGNIRYDADGTTATIQVKATVNRADGKTKEQLDFEKYHNVFGLKPEHLGAKFTSRGEEFEIAGLLPSRRKFPILAVNTRSGKRLMFTTDVVRKLK